MIAAMHAWVAIVASGVSFARSSIQSHLLRTLLTTLGVTLGVGSLVGVLSVIDGLSALAEYQISRYSGATTLTIESRRWYDDRDKRADDPFAMISDADLIGLRATVAPFGDVAVQLRGAGYVRYDGTSIASEVLATDRWRGSFDDVALAAGRSFTQRELHAAPSVAIISATLATQLSRGPAAIDLIGRTIRIGDRTLTVIGIQVPQRNEMRPSVTVPLSSRRRSAALFTGVPQQRIVVRGDRLDVTPKLLSSATEWLTLIDRNWSAKLAVVDGGGQVDVLRRNMRLATSVSAAFTLLTLFVGGIGVMNVQLVSLSERTREIGIRRAVGARRAHIVLQFLSEAMAVTIAGSALGMLLGLCGAWLTLSYWRSTTQLPIGMTVTLRTIAFSVCATVATGIVFGVYPARRAGRLSPLDAVRHE